MQETAQTDFPTTIEMVERPSVVELPLNSSELPLTTKKNIFLGQFWHGLCILGTVFKTKKHEITIIKNSNKKTK